MTSTQTEWSTSGVAPLRIQCESLYSFKLFWSPNAMSSPSRGPGLQRSRSTDFDRAEDNLTLDCTSAANLHHAMGKLTLTNNSAPVSRESSPQPCAGHKAKITRRRALAVNTQAAPALARHRFLSPHSAILPSSRRNSLPGVGRLSRHLTWEQYQETLWEHGSQLFGNNTRADAFVCPMELRFQPEPCVGDSDSPCMWSTSGNVQVRAVIRSRNHSPVGMSRSFDLAKLHSTIFEASPSPRTPSFDKGASLSALIARSNLQDSATSSPAAKDVETAASAATTATPECEHLRPLGCPVFPIHAPYARAFLPVLAAFLMCDQVHIGDTIDLPVPYPTSWTETMAYVYTGEEELLSSQVKQNIRYLGGKV